MALRRLRRSAAETQRQVADALQWDPARIVDVESGIGTLSTPELEALLDHYRPEDGDRQRLIDLAGACQGASWEQYQDVVSARTLLYMEFVSAASVVRSYQSVLIPGMLQTADYTRALMRSAYDIDERAIERIVELRTDYARLLLNGEESGGPPSTTSVILDEAAIRRAVGGTDVMREQLAHLSRLAELPHIVIQVLPFRIGAHAGLPGAFTHLEFPDPGDDDVVYAEGRLSEAVWRDEPQVVASFLRTFLRLEQDACDAQDLGDHLASARDALPAAGPLSL